MRRITLALVVALYVTVRALDMLSTPVDLHVSEVLARVGDVGTCFDGDLRDYFAVQYAYAPRIIAYEADGCA